MKARKLESETVHYGKSDPTWNLRENGATREETAFLCQGSSYQGYQGKRVELNAFTSAELVQWIESKLKKLGVKKVVPESEQLERAYRRALEIRLLNDRLEELREDAGKRVEETRVPRGLRRRIERRLKANPEMPWDAAVALEAAKKEIDG